MKHKGVGACVEGMLQRLEKYYLFSSVKVVQFYDVQSGNLIEEYNRTNTTEKKQIQQANILRELLTFIDYYGLPIGFGSLSDELKQAQKYLQK